MAGLFDRVAWVVCHPIGSFSISPRGCNVNQPLIPLISFVVLDFLHMIFLDLLTQDYSLCICSLSLVPGGSLVFSIVIFEFVLA